MIKFLTFIRDDRGFIGGGGIIERLIPLGLGLLGLAFLSFPGTMVWSDSQIAHPELTIQSDPIARAVQLAEQTVQQTEQAVQLSQRACSLSLSKFDNAGIDIDPAAPHLNLKDPRIKILMKDLYKTPQI